MEEKTDLHIFTGSSSLYIDAAKTSTTDLKSLKKKKNIWPLLFGLKTQRDVSTLSENFITEENCRWNGKKTVRGVVSCCVHYVRVNL